MNNRGVALILSYMVVAVLTVFGTIFAYRSISDSNITRRYTHSSRAFWIAESGLTQGFYDTINGQEPSQEPVPFYGGTYQITVSNVPSGIEIKSTGTYGNTTRITKGYVYFIPYPLENTMAAGGDLKVEGDNVTIKIYGKVRLKGNYEREDDGSSVYIESLEQEVDDLYTTISIPDKDGDYVSDEFEDFVLFGREVAAAYPQNKVAYFQENGTIWIWPNDEQEAEEGEAESQTYLNLSDVDIIYVEGDESGLGNVEIVFGTSLEEGEDVTIIATGSVTFYNPMQHQILSRISVISWGDYSEYYSEELHALLPPSLEDKTFLSRQGTVFSHKDVNFEDVSGIGYWCGGNIVANKDINFKEPIAYMRFDFSNKALLGNMPAGFEFLNDGEHGILSTKINRWQEVPVVVVEEEVTAGEEEEGEERPPEGATPP